MPCAYKCFIYFNITLAPQAQICLYLCLRCWSDWKKITPVKRPHTFLFYRPKLSKSKEIISDCRKGRINILTHLQNEKNFLFSNNLMPNFLPCKIFRTKQRGWSIQPSSEISLSNENTSCTCFLLVKAAAFSLTSAFADIPVQMVLFKKQQCPFLWNTELSVLTMWGKFVLQIA